MSERFIAVDWGSTHLRAWLYRDGECIAQQQQPLGVSRLTDVSACEVFEQYIAPWRQQAQTPVVMAGMIGSDAGWLPVPYLSCPVALHQLSDRLSEVAEQVWIVPGLMQQANGHHSVMRGEETQLLGAMVLAPASCYVMPGTHSKWVRTANDAVQQFATAMTGELHHLLMSQSLIGKGLPAQKENAGAFQAGLQSGLDSPSLVTRLFDARAGRLLGYLPAEHVSEWLSGLLIGAEVAAMLAEHPVTGIALVGSESLCRRYRQALDMKGVAAHEVAGDTAFLHGIRRIIDARS